MIRIAASTLQTLGARLAERHAADLVETCQAIADGTAQTRDCSGMIQGPRSLRTACVDLHFVIFTESVDTSVIVDVLHTRGDLPARFVASDTLRRGQPLDAAGRP